MERIRTINGALLKRAVRNVMFSQYRIMLVPSGTKICENELVSSYEKDKNCNKGIPQQQRIKFWQSQVPEKHTNINTSDFNTPCHVPCRL